MLSRSDRHTASPSWVTARAVRPGAPRLRAVRGRAVRWGIEGSAASDLAGAALVLGAAAALWGSALAALW